MHVTKISRPLETAALGETWLWLLLSVGPPVPAVLLLGPSPGRPVALQLGESILQMCNGGLTRLQEGYAVRPLGQAELQQIWPKWGPGALYHLELVGETFLGRVVLARLNWPGVGLQPWGGPDADRICPGALDAFLGKVLWHVLVELGLLVDPWVLAVLHWSLSSLQDLPPVWYLSWLWVI